jgi:hydrogenase expression/formation protein HypE
MADTPSGFDAFSCPVPIARYSHVLLAHGGGGKLTHELIEQLFLPAFRNALLEPLHDGALLTLPGQRIAFTTDSYVVHPLFFPGGSIGDLSVFGTVNDLAMCGAQPLYLSAAMIIEEGLLMDDLGRITAAMREAAVRSGVALVTGDTKVVDRGKGDGIFITTSGIGVIPPGVDIQPSRVRPGDAVLINGPIAQHGIAIMSVREGLSFATDIISDTAPLHTLVAAMLATGQDIHVLRDPTRGGVASTLNEIASQAKVGIELEEASVPIDEAVRGACEILGFDPLYVANEGKVLAIVPAPAVDQVLEAMRGHPLGLRGACIGHVVDSHAGIVTLRNRIGSTRIVDMLSGEQLPRIC